MSLKINILANYISQIYVTIIGIVIVPLYIKYMGAEAYGLVGFFAMLQAWFNLLDMGLTPTMARETARFRGGALDTLTFRRFVRALEGIFLIIALLGGGLLLLMSEQIAANWLTAKHLPIAELRNSIKMTAIIISLRWMCGLYRGQITGFERFVWLSSYNMAIATLRFVGVLPIIILISGTPTSFFMYNLIVALIDLIALKVISYRLLPPHQGKENIAWSWAPLKPVLKFSMTIAFTSSVWVMVTQTDKLVLSKVLPLADYGYFSLAVLVASGVMIISGPVSGAIMPRMAKLAAEDDHSELIRVYRKSTQLVTVIAGSAAVTISLFAEPLLFAWTGDRLLAQQAAPILKSYALGNGFLAVSAFPYYLQYAKGNLRLHLIGNAGFVIVLIPAIIWSTTHYGGTGAGYVWLMMNVAYFIGWVPLIHCKLEPGLNFLWFGRDVAVIGIVATITGVGLLEAMPLGSTRLSLAATVIGAGIVILVSAACATSTVWEKLRAFIEQRQVRQGGTA